MDSKTRKTKNKKALLLLVLVLPLALSMVACDNDPVINPERDTADGDWIEENAPILDALRDCSEDNCLAEPIGKFITADNYTPGE